MRAAHRLISVDEARDLLGLERVSEVRDLVERGELQGVGGKSRHRGAAFERAHVLAVKEERSARYQGRDGPRAFDEKLRPFVEALAELVLKDLED